MNKSVFNDEKRTCKNRRDDCMASYDVFTPRHIADAMRAYFPEKVHRLLEPSVGTGDLLRSMDGAYEHADVFEINADYLAKIPDIDTITKHHEDFLSTNIATKYDAILMNPPYLRFQDMSSELRKAVRGLSDILRRGNIDLYIAFLVKCIQLLSDTGMLVAIVPSTWMYNKSCSSFRAWLFEHKLVHAIHDYGSEKVFPGVDVYCCILVVTHAAKDSYTRNGEVVPYATTEKSHTVQCLGDVCDIQNGVATLCDGVFIHDQALFSEPCWKPIYKVSKNKLKYIIYPYDESGVICSEDVFREQNPQTYSYLQDNRKRLESRDRGHKTYEAWYAFGRKQGLKLPDAAKSVYISTLSAPGLPTVCDNTMLFYSGIRITPTATTCDVIQESISKQKSDILSLCSKRSGGWINITTTVLRQVQVRQ